MQVSFADIIFLYKISYLSISSVLFLRKGQKAITSIVFVQMENLKSHHTTSHALWFWDFWFLPFFVVKHFHYILPSYRQPQRWLHQLHRPMSDTVTPPVTFKPALISALALSHPPKWMIPMCRAMPSMSVAFQSHLGIPQCKTFAACKSIFLSVCLLSVVLWCGVLCCGVLRCGVMWCAVAVMCCDVM